MRELDLLFRSFSMDSLPNLGKDELLMLDEILNSMIKSYMIIFLRMNH